MAPKSKLSLSEQVDVTNKYKSGLSSIKIGKIHNLSNGRIIQILKKFNVPIRGYRKYFIDHDYFSKIDTEEKAYILGILCADGWNGENKKEINLSLQEDDVSVLRKILICMNANYPIYTKTGSHNSYLCPFTRKQAKISIYSPQISKDLANHGCTQRKSLTLKYPASISYALERHFIRGYFDGDGSISYQYFGNNYLKISLTICGSKDFTTELKDRLKKYINVNFHLAKRANMKISVIQTTGNSQSLRFLRWIYDNSKIYLDRKYNRFKEFETAYNVKRGI